jgi:hypothetical protein
MQISPLRCEMTKVSSQPSAFVVIPHLLSFQICCHSTDRRHVCS